METALYEQLSLFDGAEGHSAARCCADGRSVPLGRLEAWMLKLVPSGEHVVFVAHKPLVLSPVCCGQIREEHRYYHYMIGGQVYAGVFVG